MLINLRNGMLTGKKLPYDAEVEYLESSGTQYVDTNTIDDPVNNLAQITFSIPTSTGATMNLFGSSDSKFNYVSARWGSSRYNLGPSAATTPVLPISVGDIHVGTYTLTNNELTYTLDGESAVYSSSLVYDNLPLAIFCIYGRPDTAPFIGRVYSFKIIRKLDGTVIADLIPVRKGAIGYLYDRVSRKLFGNAGTGDFVIGPDVVPVEWIQTDGAAHIDTGLEMADGHEVRAEHYFKRSTTRQLMGSNASRQYYGVSADGYVEFGLLGTNKSTVSVDETKKYLISYAASGGNNTGSIYEGDTLLWSGSGAYYGFSNSFKIFRLSTNVQLSFVAGNKIASFKHIASGETIQSLLPVRVGTDATSWEGAMMDTLTRRIYRNAGTGAFAYGNDLKYPIPSE